MSALPDDPFVIAGNGWGQALETGRLLCRALLELDADDDADGLVAAIGALDEVDLRDALLALVTEGESVIYDDEDEEQS
jgi:hypothetical protein